MVYLKEFSALETPRLILRRFAGRDVADFIRYRNDPEIARYQSWHSISESEALGFVQEQMVVLPGMPGKWFQPAIILKETQQLIGDCGLHTLAEDQSQAEMGISLAKPFQGCGYGFEAISAILDFSFKELGMHRIIATTDCENTPSANLLARLGMRREGHFIENIWFKGKWGDEYLYAILKDEWLGR